MAEVRGESRKYLIPNYTPYRLHTYIHTVLQAYCLLLETVNGGEKPSITVSTQNRLYLINFQTSKNNLMDLGRILKDTIPVLVALALWELVVRGLIMRNTYDDSQRLEGRDHSEN